MKIFLYEKFENKNNLLKIKKKYNLINLNYKKINKKKVFAIYSRFSKKLSKNYFSKFENLKTVISPTTGLNHIDIDYCNKEKIKIINLKKGDKRLQKISSTSEMALSMILSGIRKLPYFYQNLFKLSDRYRYPIYQFRNYTVGIIGYGRIGKKLYRDLKYLNFRVFFFDIDIKLKKKEGYLSLQKLLKRSDVVSLNMSYNEGYFNFFDKKLLNVCKKNLILVNTARGELINEHDLLHFLKKNTNSAAYLDVIQSETTNYNKNILYKYSKQNKNLYITPHLGGSTNDALKETEDVVINDFLKQKNK